jgi:hypothetical protein
VNKSLVAQGIAIEIARGEGLRWALIIMVTINVWSFIHYMIGAKTLVRDSVGPDPHK